MPTLDAKDLPERLGRDGYAVVPGLIEERRLASLRSAFAAERGNRRNVLAEVPEARALLSDPGLASLVRSLFPASDDPAAVRGIAFDKTHDSNRAVAWHQDLSIAVAERPGAGEEPENFGPWSTKAGVPHVEPPAALLGSMLTVRLHLDDADAGNGALRVRPGSHGAGRLVAASGWSGPPEVVLAVAAGDAVLMRPLLLHASSKAVCPTRRRVLHLEFAAASLPDPLVWAQHHPLGSGNVPA